ncbi:hypothetical protein T12_4446 [Trichinella patagoniensis]|uniref:Uncharacterized protein n=1 Tax=Trichinella patagoniensis TaxID=990121 RepID=A0A0V1AAT8_9BILA|nr:hypothetical protein T12_4446 [Trichinella patagoniensis]
MAIRTERGAVEIATPPDGYTLATRVNFESGENVTFRFQTTTTCQFGIVNDGASDNSADSGQQCGKNKPALCVHSRGWSPKRRWRSGREAPTLDAEDLTSFAVAKRLAGGYFLFGKSAVIRELPVLERPKLIYNMLLTDQGGGCKCGG